MSPLPAHYTKHLSQLQYPFRQSTFYLTQLDNGQTNGSALWLGAQCLSCYLADVLAKKSFTSRPKAIELGSGIGLTSLVMATLGWDVLATDLPDVIASVLFPNITRNLPTLPPGAGTIQVRSLDWLKLPEEWNWQDPVSIAPSSPKTHEWLEEGEMLEPPFDLILSADTLYSPSLSEPLLRTLHALAMKSVKATSGHAPPVYICLERRDPILIDQVLADARDHWNFVTERIPHKKVAKALERGGLQWEREDWDGVEIWKLSMKTV
ncbi:hypothetical protein C8Q75DRAFT_739968 [Abortiporus biennis]|nr:hypothetical protein C8Q75DRAFT_739968 [Abortiporus biennis]